ncbi:MAG: cysteine synthase A [Candidatus Sumerlaeia bacterium]
MGRLFNDITETVGNTPLVRLNRVAREAGCRADVYLKLEFFNPLGSVKDRIGVAMIDDAERRGLIRPGASVLIEPTSGNTGIGLAFAAAARGYTLILTMPDTMTIERRKLLKILGARLVLTDGSRGMRGAIDKAEELQAKIPGSVIPQQFSNPSNPEIHRRTTAEEIWNDTDGRVDVVVCGVGTGGTITGVGEALKVRKPSVRMVALEPETSQVMAGKPAGPHRIQGIGAGFIPKVLNMGVVDEIIPVTEADVLRMNREVTRKEGIPIGLSSGAAVWAALEIGKRPGMEGKLIVAIAPSSSERYLSAWIYADIDAESDPIDDLMK